MAEGFTFNFDLLLACLLPLAFFFAAFRLNWPHQRTWNSVRYYVSLKAFREPRYGPFSLENAYQSFEQYLSASAIEIHNRWATYHSLGRAHRRLGNTIGYPSKLEKLKDAMTRNAIVTRKIADLAAKELDFDHPYHGYGDLGRVREALKHFIRDWSEEGTREREKIFSPILNVLRAVEPSQRETRRVLVPGSGLGRLAWEISQLGYDTTANELSSFMNLAFRFLLSEQTTTSTNEHIIYPYAHWFSHQQSNDRLFRAIRFPDVIPRFNQRFRLAENDFLSLSPPRQALSDNKYDSPMKSFWNRAASTSQDGRQSGYDYIVTLFFLDTSLNVLATMEQIYSLLRPGGTWINLGPLLWTSGGHAKLELSLEEVLHAAEEIGFIIHSGDAANDINVSRTVECEYTGDPEAMMRWIYKAEFWVATKSE